jgi:hypothetical protein
LLNQLEEKCKPAFFLSFFSIPHNDLATMIVALCDNNIVTVNKIPLKVEAQHGFLANHNAHIIAHQIKVSI